MGRLIPILAMLLLTGSASPAFGESGLGRAEAALVDTVGARWVHQALGLDGSGVGVALIDSGVAAWHDDLPPGRVVQFVDFVNGQASAYDDYGHGTHLAGMLGADGYSSDGLHRGIAPGAHLVVLKVLDANGDGRVESILAALDYAVAHRERYNIRVINLSLATPVSESSATDPLALAVRRAVESGMVVVTAAGNHGRTAHRVPAYGRIAAPGNAPWALTVGAANDRGTIERTDDRVAAFSSRGPTRYDHAPKPDLVAPGVGIVSLADAASGLFAARVEARRWGTRPSAHEPYLALSGTSMASAVVTGTVALMLQANPRLTPNAVKGILHYTAWPHPGYDLRTQGAGFLNVRGAVQLAREFAGRTAAEADPTPWARHVIWGSLRLRPDRLGPQALAWRADVAWGSDRTPAGEPVVWDAPAEDTAAAVPRSRPARPLVEDR